MKITIEHEKFTATTDDFDVARQLCQMAGLLSSHATRKEKLVRVPKPADVPSAEIVKPATPPPVDDADEPLLPFNPAWTEHDVDFDKNYLEQYSNPCSTMCGQCGNACIQTELWLRDKNTGELSVCDVEFYTRDELRATLEPYIALAKREIAAAAAKKLPCSMERLKQIAKLFNAGASDDEIMEQLHISQNSVKTYRAAARRTGLLK